MALSIGIVGLPNVGKSTLFNILTESKSADAANFPFCTIDPNKGIVSVPDLRINKLAQIVKSEKEVPATIEFIDIAGLVKGASLGEGLGNQFLANIRETDAICQIVRVFENSDVIHVDGNINPKRDVEIIETELLIKDLETVGKRINSIDKKSQTTNDKVLQKTVGVLKKLKIGMEQEKLAKNIELNENEEELIKDLQLLTKKPFIYVANTNEDQDTTDLHETLGLDKNEIVIPISIKQEQELADLDKEERALFLEELGIEESALDVMIRKAFESLDLITYLTAGEKEVRAWTINKGFTANKAAGVIHTDFEKGFIKADVVNFDDFVEHKGWSNARENGRVRQEGKEYIVKDGDIMLFKFNV